MSSGIDWQCGDCGTAIDGTETRRCPSCGGINFFPRADAVPGGESGTLETTVDIERALDAFSERSDRAVALGLRRVGRDELASVEELLSVNDLPTEDLQAVELFVASNGSERIGVGGLERRGSNALLRSIVVEEAVRGQGYGTALTRRLLQHARDSGIETVYLLTTTAADFFITLGFQEIERERVPASIRTTREFVDLCPDSAVCLRKRLK